MRMFILLLMIFVLVMPSIAQDDGQPADPLEGMLSLIPGSLAQLDMVSYVNFDNVVAARPDAPQVTSWEELSTTDNREILTAAFAGIASGPDFARLMLVNAERMPDVMGFSPFDVSAAVGAPSLSIIWGDFDVDAVIAAHESRGFVASALEDYTLLCGADGCDAGNQTNIAAVDNANIFGGNLGRSQPTIISEDMIASSESYNMIMGVTSANAYLTDSLYVQTALDVINNTEGLLIQVTLLDGLMILPASSNFVTPMMMTGMSAEQIEEEFARLAEAFEVFPRFNMVAMSDHATETEQIVNVILTYNSEEAAQTTADILPRRIETYISTSTEELLIERLEEQGISFETTVFTSERTGYSAAVITFRAPLAENDSSETGFMTASSMVYGLMRQAVLYRDLGWLSPEW